MVADVEADPGDLGCNRQRCARAVLALILRRAVIGVFIVQRGLAGLERLGEILDVVPSIRDRADALPLARLEGAVAVRGLSFAFPVM